MTRPVPLFWISFVLMVAGAAAIVLWIGPIIEAGANGLEPFDTRRRGYSHAEAVAFLSGLSDAARAAYLGPERVADTVFPIGLLGVLTLGAFIGLRVWSRVLALIAGLPALAYFLCDMLENATVAAMLRADPAIVTPEFVAQASALTVWKFHFVYLALAILVLAWIARRLAWIRRAR